MSAEQLSFGAFTLDPANRTLRRGDEPVEVSARYLDALILLARAPGELVTKDRFLEEVWRGVPVTDEALTQCIRSLRKALGDDAKHPRFIETVPRHGYRFVADVAPLEAVGGQSSPTEAALPTGVVPSIVAGTLGAAAAGMIVGIVYGLFSAGTVQQGGSAMSGVLVLMLVCALSAAVGGMGIAAGIALTRRVVAATPGWPVAGGALGGLITGAFAQSLGRDAFQLLTGSGPLAMAGALDGTLLGAATGLALWIGDRANGRGPLPILVSGLTGAIAGLATVILGGAMMAGSLQGLSTAFPASRLGALPIGAPFDPLLGAFEGAIFVTGLVIGLRVFQRLR